MARFWNLWSGPKVKPQPVIFWILVAPLMLAGGLAGIKRLVAVGSEDRSPAMVRTRGG